MEPEIKSSYDKERNRRNKRRWSHRMDYLWMVPLYLLKQIGTLFVKYPYVPLAIVILIVASVLFSKISKTSSIKVTTTEHIGTTTNQIQSIREIRQWEALAIECEEMVDTAEEHFFGDKNLVRIYTGTLRLGVDMKNATDDWFTAKGDTAFLKLPQITLLNPEFIDEARTRTFTESGKWNAATYEALYRKARSKMLQRSFGKGQRQQAARNITEKFESMFRAFGYKHIEITWNEEKEGNTGKTQQ